MAGWAYSNFGEDQQTAQDDQLQQLDARAQLRMIARQTESKEFQEAAKNATSPTVSGAQALVPLKATAMAAIKKKAPVKIPSFIQPKKRPAEESSSSRLAAEETSSSAAAGAAAMADEESPPKRGRCADEPSSTQQASVPASAAGNPAQLASLVAYDDSDDEEAG